MKLHASLLVSFLLLVLMTLIRSSNTENVAAESGAEWSEESLASRPEPPIELNSATYAETIKKYKSGLLILFTQRICSLCSKIEPLLPRVKFVLAENGVNIHVATLNMSREDGLVISPEVTQVPNLRFFARGQIWDYDGKSNFNSLMRWIDKKKRNPISEVPSDKALKSLIDRQETVVVFTEFSFDQLYDLVSLAEEHQDAIFVTKRGSDKHPDRKIEVFKPYDLGYGKYTGDLDDLEAIKQWVSTEVNPVVAPFHNEDVIKSVFSTPGATSLILYSQGLDNPDFLSFHDLAKTSIDRRRFNLVHGRMDVEATKELYSYMGRDYSNKTELWIVVKKENSIEKYPYEGEFSREGIEKFLAEYERGQINPLLKSQEVPEQPDEHITYLVSKNFEKEVVLSPQHFLVMFFSPKCEYSKELGPHFDKLAKDLHVMQDVVRFGVIDGPENELKVLKVVGYPSIFLFKKDKLEPEVVEFSEERSRKGLIKFLTDQLPDIAWPESLKEESKTYTYEAEELTPFNEAEAEEFARLLAESESQDL